MVAANSINEATTGIAGFTGIAFTATPVTNHAIILGGATSSTLGGVGPSATAGQVLQSAGAAADPTFSTATYPATAGTSGNILTSNGTNWTSAAPATSGTVTSVSGTANQVAVANGTTTPVISLIGPYTPATYTAHGVLIGEGTSSIAALAAGSAGQVLQSGGASADPTYSTATYPAIATGTGTILRADGTNWVATTATYPATTTINQVLYSSSNNVVAGITAANNGTLISGTTGIPSWLANGTTGQVLTATTSNPPSWTTIATGLTWSVVTVDASFTVNTGTIANKGGLLIMTLPASAAIGDIIEITGINTALGWKIAQNANQQIFFGTSSTTLGATGSIASINIRDSLRIVCVVAGASTVWNVISSVGNMTIV